MRIMVMFIILNSCSIISNNTGYNKIGGVDGGHYIKIQEKKTDLIYRLKILNEQKQIIVEGDFQFHAKCKIHFTKRELLKKINFYDNAGRIYLIEDNEGNCHLELIKL